MTSFDLLALWLSDAAGPGRTVWRMRRLFGEWRVTLRVQAPERTPSRYYGGRDAKSLGAAIAMALERAAAGGDP